MIGVANRMYRAAAEALHGILDGMISRPRKPQWTHPAFDGCLNSEGVCPALAYYMLDENGELKKDFSKTRAEIFCPWCKLYDQMDQP